MKGRWVQAQPRNTGQVCAVSHSETCRCAVSSLVCPTAGTYPRGTRCPSPLEVSPGLCPPHPLFHSDAAFETKCPYHRLLSTCSSCTCDDRPVVSLTESSVLGVRLHRHLEGTCLLALAPCHKPPTHALHKACAQLARWFVFTQQPRCVGRREVGGGSQAPQPQGGPRGLARDQDDRCVLGLVSAQLGT